MTTALPDTEPQTAAGKVLWHFTMSLDGFVAGPEPRHGLDGRHHQPASRHHPGVHGTTGAILGGRDGFEAFPNADSTYDGALASARVHPHPPSRRRPAHAQHDVPHCDLAEAVRLGLEAAGGKNVEVLSASIGRQPSHAA